MHTGAHAPPNLMVAPLGSPHRLAAFPSSQLLMVARPPPSLVRNKYLEDVASERVAPLLYVCLTFGATGEVPEKELASMGLAPEDCGAAAA